MNKKKQVKYMLYLLISIIFISILSKSTSPLYDGSYAIDSSIFKLIGKGITRGYIPYVDLFDHKGPILFFIQAIGVSINEKVGIFWFQIVNCFITIVFLDKLIELFDKDEKKKNIVLIATLILYAVLFGEGNFSEEWSLSLITISFYTICKGLINNVFTKKEYFINGLIFAVISLIRVNNAATVIGFCVFYFIYLIKQKEYKELGNFIVYFIFGMIVIYIPNIIIFIRWNAFYEMLNATFLFNFKYSFGVNSFSKATIFYKLSSLIPLIFLFLTIFYSKNSGKIKICLYTIIVVNAICVSLGYGYLHYYMILVPLFAVLFTQIKNNIKSKQKIKSIIGMYMILCGIIMWISSVNLMLNWDKYNYNRQKILESEAKELIPYIKDDQSVMCYNMPARIYLILDIMPCYKYFCMQSWQGQFNKIILDEFIKHIENKNVRYIITYKQETQEFLNQYDLIYKNNTFKLYEIK